MSQQAEKLAKTARTALAEALNALQTSADVPDALMEVADPIANAMGILHRIERTQGQDLTGKELALKHVRAALDLLQSFEFSHEALDIVMEKVAGCLTAVHQVARMAAPSAPQAAPPPAAAPAPSAVPAAPASSSSARDGAAGAPAPPQTIKPMQTIPIGQPSPVASTPMPKATPSSPGLAPRAPTPSPQGYVPLPIPPPPAPAAPSAGIHGTQMMAEPTAPSPALDPSQDSVFPLSRPVPSGPQLSVREVSHPVSQQAFQPAPAFPPASTAPQPSAPQPSTAPAAPIGITTPMHQSLGATAPFSQPQPQSYGAPQIAQSTVPAGPQSGRPSSSVQPAPTSQARPSPRSSTKSTPELQGNVVVELGAHSASNFYKGLGGNDVIEHGGLFVATYRIPKLGTTVMLRVLLPGDYEFTASGTVQWTREPTDGNESFDPGFGARFTQITPEGRQLVYRYTRNREPMFYDDL